MSLKVNTETLIKNLLERHTLKELFAILAKGLSKQEIHDAIVEMMNKLDLSTYEMVDICLDTENGKKNTDEVTKEFISQVFDEVHLKRKKEFHSIWDYENKCLPYIEDLIDVINKNYIGSDPVLETYSTSTLLDYIEDTNELEDYCDEYADDKLRDIKQDLEEEYTDAINRCVDSELLTETPDKAWEWVCNQVGSSYYDKDKVDSWLKRLSEHISKSSYMKLIEREKSNGKSDKG